MIEFKNPPVSQAKPRGPGQQTLGIIEALQARPGEWALIKADVNVNASSWWKKQPGLEAKASTIDKPKGKCDVYARWVGVKP